MPQFWSSDSKNCSCLFTNFDLRITSRAQAQALCKTNNQKFLCVCVEGHDKYIVKEIKSYKTKRMILELFSELHSRHKHQSRTDTQLYYYTQYTGFLS